MNSELKKDKYNPDFHYEEILSQDRERTLIVLVYNRESDAEKRAKEDELIALVESSGGEVLGVFNQNINKANSRTLIGKGKVEEIADFVKNHEIDLVVFNEELTGSQMKNLSDQIPSKVIDRVDLILDIFAIRARTKKSKLQVKLAQLEYRLPRLKGYGTALSRVGGGIGTRGPGEQQLEVDRRAIEREIISIKDHLDKLSDQEGIASKRRRESKIPILSLVGYTNVGKSSILNRFIQWVDKTDTPSREVYADDRLFATLDVHSRRIQAEGERPYLLADTVGFIEDLPDRLQPSFESSLEEISFSDLILIVIDSSSPAYDQQIDTILRTIQDIGQGIERLYIMNKSDLNQPPIVTPKEKTIRISAQDKESILALHDLICTFFYGKINQVHILFSYKDLGILSEYLDQGYILDQKHTEDGVRVRMLIREDQVAQLEERLARTDSRILGKE